LKTKLKSIPFAAEKDEKMEAYPKITKAALSLSKRYNFNHMFNYLINCKKRSELTEFDLFL
jgi:hypothetical protein